MFRRANNLFALALVTGLVSGVTFFPAISFGQDDEVESPTSVETADQEDERPPRIESARSDRPIDKNRILDLTFDDLAFEMEKGEKFLRSMLTDSINEFDGARIKLRGYIRPSFKQKGLTKFVFVRDNKECCFGPGAALYDCVLVSLEDGEETDFTVRPVIVEGRFYLKEYTGPDGKVWSIYRMKSGKIK